MPGIHQNIRAASPLSLRIVNVRLSFSIRSARLLRRRVPDPADDRKPDLDDRAGCSEPLNRHGGIAVIILAGEIDFAIGLGDTEQKSIAAIERTGGYCISVGRHKIGLNYCPMRCPDSPDGSLRCHATLLRLLLFARPLRLEPQATSQEACS
jgi:hypothetical protein